MLLSKLGLLLMGVGALVSILFWMPKIVNHSRLKVILGKRYFTIYFFYFTNGPFLMIVGYYLYRYQA